ncbi:MAG: hypothetical protein ABIF71_07800 [Planctomycetota bacterium]
MATRKKHPAYIPPPKGPQSDLFRKSRGRKFRLKWGLSDNALAVLGFKHPLGRVQKVLFVISVCMAMVPFWFALERKRFARSVPAAVIAFTLNLAAWCAGGWAIWNFVHT